MTCRTCGVEIADKAIVCFRCGTPTAIPAAVSRPGRTGGAGYWIAAGAGVAAFAGWLATQGASLNRTRAAGATGVLIVYVVIVLILRGRARRA